MPEADELTGDDLLDLSKRVGEAGERLLSVIVNDAKGIANRVEVDRLGWDFHVQLPRDSSWMGTHSLDTRPPEISVFVQVKASTRRISSWRVSLAVLERLVKERRPAFFAIFLFSKDDLVRPNSLHLVHVDENLIESVLRELTVISSTGGSDLSDRHLRIHWSACHEIAPLTGDSFAKRVESAVGPDLLAYEQRKAELVRRTGYPARPMRMSMRALGATSDELRERLRDFSIGRLKELDIEVLSSEVERFGIVRPSETGPKPGPARISFPDLEPDLRGEVEIVGKSRSERVSMPCAAFTGALMGAVIPPSDRGMRFSSDYFEILVSPGADKSLRVTVELSPPKNGEQVSLARAERAAMLALALTDPEGSLLTLRLAESPAIQFALPRMDDQNIEMYGLAVRWASAIARHVGLDAELIVEPARFSPAVEPLALAGSGLSVTLSLPAGGAPPAPSAILIPREVPFGPYRACLVVAVTGDTSVDDATGILSVAAVPQILSFATARTEETIDWEALLCEAENISRERGIEEIFSPRDAKPRLQE